MKALYALDAKLSMCISLYGVYLVKNIKELIYRMKDNDARKAFGLRVKELRKLRGLTQKELANKIGGLFPQINKYESGLSSPPLEKIIKLAEVLDTSADYL